MSQAIHTAVSGLKTYPLSMLEKLPELAAARFEDMAKGLVDFGAGDAVDGRLVRWWVWQHFAALGLPLPVGSWIRRRIPDRFHERRNGSSRIVAKLHPAVGFLDFKDDPRGPDGWADARGHLVVDPNDVAGAIGNAVLQRRLIVEGQPWPKGEP